MIGVGYFLSHNMPRSTGRKLVVLPSRSVRQAELLALVQIENEIERLSRERNRITKDIINHIQSGGTVESGLYHLRIAEQYISGRKRTRLILE